ncbi:MAG TPA: DUF6171 family protein [Terrimicrobiaceae bacterium]|nr:DUF6171 family protein [Terrimicrobiaceae bacterium]
MISIPLAKLQSVAALKPQGYYNACLRAGTVVGDNLELSERAFAELRARFSPPPRGTQIRSFAGAVVAECGAALAGEPSITGDQKADRLAVCEGCEFFVTADRRCSQCGCWMDAKAGFRSAVCPENKWPALT